MRRYLVVEEVLLIHAELIEEFGGSHGIRDEKSLESAVERPRTGYYEDIIEEASALMESLAMNHCFIDGNKRVSFFCTDIFLRLNGYSISCSAKEGHEFFIKNLENRTFRYEEIKKWLREKVVKGKA